MAVKVVRRAAVMALMFVCGLLPVISYGYRGVMAGMISLVQAHSRSIFIAASCLNRQVRCHCL